MTTEHAVAPSEAPDTAVLDALQERMDRIIRGEAPNTGQFCGYCYARLEREAQRCAVCGRETSAIEPVTRVPRDALRVYNAHRGKMRLWVNLFAFLGIFLAIVLAGLIVTFLPNPWLWFAVPVMFFGSWYLANLLGGGIGGMLGIKQGTALRAIQWQQLLQRRAAGENLDAR